MYFCKGYDFGEKVDLSKGCWNPKTKMWVTTHFSEIIKSAHPEISPGGVQNEKIENSQTLPE